MSNPKLIHTIVNSDVGNSLSGPLAKKIGMMGIANMMGKILPCDVGKRVYAVTCDDGETIIYQVENNEQRDTRLKA